MWGDLNLLTTLSDIHWSWRRGEILIKRYVIPSNLFREIIVLKLFDDVFVSRE